MANRLTHTDLVILDVLSYLPFGQADGALLFGANRESVGREVVLLQIAGDGGIRQVAIEGVVDSIEITEFTVRGRWVTNRM